MRRENVQGKQRAVFYFVSFLVFVLFSGCATGRGTGSDVWGDAVVIAKQRAEIEQLRRDLADMGNLIGEVSDGIDRLTVQLNDGLTRSYNIENVFGEVDQFVRGLIDENRKLRAIRQTDSGTDAGER